MNKEKPTITSSSHLRKNLFIYIAIGLLILTLFLSISTILPIYSRLRAAEDRNIYHAVQTRAMAINEWVRRAKDLAWQITSRTRIRQELEKYNNGKISLEQLRSFTEPKLVDAMNSSKEVIGITRLDIEGQTVAKCGLSIPKAEWPISVFSTNDIAVSTPIIAQDHLVIIIGAPILNRKGKSVGIDMVAIGTPELKTIATDYTGLGKTSEIILGYSSDDQIRAVFPLRIQNKQSEIAKPLDNNLQVFLQNAIDGKNGLEYIAKTVMAYTPIDGCNLGLLITQDENELYAPLHSKLITIGLLSILVYSVFLFGFWLTMKPLAGRLLLHTNELEATIKAKTRHLQKEISERKRAEKALHLNEARLESQLKLSQMTIAPLKKITDFSLEEAVGLTNSKIGYLAFMNEDETVLTMYSWSKQAMKECGIIDKPIVYPIESTGLWGEAVRERKPIITNDYAAKNPLKKGCPKGHVKIERHMNVPIFDGDKIVAVAGVGNKHEPYDNADIRQLTLLMQGMWIIAKRQRAEEALRESEKKYRNLFDNAQVGIFRTRPSDGIVLEANQQLVEMFGFGSRAEAINRIFATDCYEEPEIRSQMLAKMEKNGEIRNFEARFRRNDGSVFWGRLSCLRYEEEGYFEGVITDITENKLAEKEKVRLQAQLLQAKKMEAVGALAGGVAHDLNNILSGLISYPELLLLDMPDDSPLKKPLHTIKNSGEKAAAIVQDLLTLARRGVKTDQVVNLKKIVEEYLASPECDRLRSFHPDVTIETDFRNALLRVKGSPTHFSKTVMNLVSNATEAIPGGGTVQILLENRHVDYPIGNYEQVAEGDYVALTVSDTGLGIAAEDIERIFEPFYTKKKMGRSGTGLGMAVVWGAVKDHNGYIDIQSRPGEGSRFTLYFPATRIADDMGEKESFNLEQHMGKGEFVLIVDDMADQREIATSIVEKLGYRSASVSNGEEAIEFLENNEVDMVLLDMIMDPGINGLETYKRAVNSCPGLRAVIASGFSKSDHVREAQQLGVGGYLKKPYTIESLAKAIAEELKRKKTPDS